MAVYTRHRGAQIDDKCCAEKSVEVVGSMGMGVASGAGWMLVANGAILVVELWVSLRLSQCCILSCTKSYYEEASLMTHLIVFYEGINSK